MFKLGAVHITNYTGVKHKASVIFFHGSGADGASCKEWAEQVSIKKPFTFKQTRIVYPTAPSRPYTPAGGDVRNVWFDRAGVTPFFKEIRPSVEEIKPLVMELIKTENDLGVPTENIIVGGFSMGGSLALNVAYKWEPKLAGVFVLSSFLNEDSSVYDHLENYDGKLPPLIQIQGDVDTVVQYKWGEETHNKLLSFGVDGEFHKIRRLGHSLDPKGISLVNDFIKKLVDEK